MKKINTLLLIVSCVTSHVFAQGFFNQNATERKYQLEQIANLKAYSALLKKGYNVTKDGTTLIGNIKNGEFGLHTAYFNSLKAVNPAIKNDSRVRAILIMQSSMASQRQSIARVATESKVFSSAEINNVNTLLTNLSGQATEDLDELELVVTDGKVQMTDDERINAIGKLYALAQDKYSYLKKLSRNITSTAIGRKQGIRDAATLKNLYGSGN